MKNELSARQLYLLLGVFLPVGRLVLLPSYLTAQAGSSLLLSAAIALLLEFFAVATGVFYIARARESAFDTLRRRLGKAGSGAYFLWIFALLFTCLLPVTEHRLYVQYTEYDFLPTMTVFAPFFLFGAYACSRELTALGRSADVGAILFCLSFPVLLFMGIGGAKFTRLLPFAPDFSGVVWGVRSFLPWINVGAWLPLLAKKVGTMPELKGKFVKNCLLFYAVGGAVYLIFLCVFFGVFGKTGVGEKFALARLGLFYEALKTLGRVDFIFIHVMLIVQLFALLPPLALSTHALSELFKCKKTTVAVAVFLALFLLAFPLQEKFISFFALLRDELSPVYLVLLFLPSALLFLNKGGEREKNQ